jgi:hypothetical protein
MSLKRLKELEAEANKILDTLRFSCRNMRGDEVNASFNSDGFMIFCSASSFTQLSNHDAYRLANWIINTLEDEFKK